MATYSAKSVAERLSKFDLSVEALSAGRVAIAGKGFTLVEAVGVLKFLEHARNARQKERAPRAFDP